MSTRSIIAKPNGDGFIGRYCHWDGYPTCRGAQIWASWSELGGDVEALRQYALRPDREGSWSSFMTPSEEAENKAQPDTVVCDLCDGTGDRRAKDVEKGRSVVGDRENYCNGCDSTGTAINQEANRGWHDETGECWLKSDGPDCGTEWAYVLGDVCLTVFERRYGPVGDDQGHGTGMFGMGASDTENGGHWALVGTFQWGDTEPDWDWVENKLNQDEAVEVGA